MRVAPCVCLPLALVKGREGYPRGLCLAKREEGLALRCCSRLALKSSASAAPTAPALRAVCAGRGRSELVPFRGPAPGHAWSCGREPCLKQQPAGAAGPAGARWGGRAGAAGPAGVAGASRATGGEEPPQLEQHPRGGRGEEACGRTESTGDGHG
jgi:hypothetical protein